jgi:hypothetical protein
VPIRRIPQQNRHLPKDFVQVDDFPFCRASPVKRANSVDDAGSARHRRDHCRGSAACFLLIGWVTTEPSQAGVGGYDGGGDRLLDLVGQRGSQFSHHAHAVHVREICFELAQSFALFFGAFALGDICYRTYEDQTLRIFTGDFRQFQVDNMTAGLSLERLLNSPRE